MSLPATPKLRSRKSRPLLQEKSSPRTPKSAPDDRTSPTSMSICTPPTPSSALRLRRGRRRASGSSASFRPLSVFTRSIFAPLGLDTDHSFIVIDTDKERATVDNEPDKPKPSMTSEPKFETPRKTSPPMPSTAASLLVQPNVPALCSLSCNQESSMDLLTALQTTSPEKDKPEVVKADYETLIHLPPPDLANHPAFSADPFKSTSQDPLLLTGTAAAQIGATRKGQSQSPEHKGLRSVERKKSFFGFDLRTPSSTKSRNAFSEASLEYAQGLGISVPNSGSAVSSVSPEPTDSVSVRASASSLASSTGGRKFSDIFKPKASMDRPPLLSASSASFAIDSSPIESPNLARSDLELYLRRTTNTPTYDHTLTSQYPRHPHTGRGWKSRNLKCTNCTDECCAVCKRSCCAYKAAVTATENHDEGSNAHSMAHQRVQEITKLFPYGKEAPTFLQCTRNCTKDGLGCGRLVCPDCCSVCPDDACGDLQCRRCKPSMWEECSWHKKAFIVRV